jgi:hypothetical protein
MPGFYGRAEARTRERLLQSQRDECEEYYD